MVNKLRIQGYKSFRDSSVDLGNLNLLIGSNGAGKSNFLSLFELLNNAFEQPLVSYVATIGGMDKLLFQGRKATEKIDIKLLMNDNSYELILQETDERLLVAEEKLANI